MANKIRAASSSILPALDVIPFQPEASGLDLTAPQVVDVSFGQPVMLTAKDASELVVALPYLGETDGFVNTLIDGVKRWIGTSTIIEKVVDGDRFVFRATRKYVKARKLEKYVV